MILLTRTSALIAALALASPVLAQQAPTKGAHKGTHIARHVSKPSKPPAPDGSLQGGYQKYCGARFVCYTGIPLNCTADTRPYQDISNHECFCLRDACPQ
jgi:hypothetical protein